jgi:hypothetical protein
MACAKRGEKEGFGRFLMSERLPPWYLKGLREEILRLREMAEPLENQPGSVGDKTLGSLTSQTLDRHKKAIAELQSILEDNDAAKL